MADLGSQSGQWRLGHLIMFDQIFKYIVFHQVQLDLSTRFLHWQSSARVEDVLQLPDLFAASVRKKKEEICVHWIPLKCLYQGRFRPEVPLKFGGSAKVEKSSSTYLELGSYNTTNGNAEVSN